MGEVSTIGLDIAKSVFQVHGVDAEGATVVRKQLRRAQLLTFFSKLPRCLVGMEACATAHYWARELRALGHEPRHDAADCPRLSARRGDARVQIACRVVIVVVPPRPAVVRLGHVRIRARRAAQHRAERAGGAADPRG